MLQKSRQKMPKDNNANFTDCGHNNHRLRQQKFKIHQTDTCEIPGTQLAVEIMYMSYHYIYLQYIKAKINVSQSSKSFFPVCP